jgi:hypothetical protein
MLSALALAAFLATLVWMALGLGRGRDPLLVYLVATIFLFYGLRSTIFVFGLDKPEPAEFFHSNSDNHLLALTLASIITFLLCAGLAYWTWSEVRAMRLPVYAARELDPRRMLWTTIVLTGVATLVTIVLLAHFGGPDGVLRAGKVTHGLSGLYVLRTFGAIGAIMAAATIVDSHQHGLAPSTQLLAGVCALLDSYYVYLWGTRTVAVIVLVIVILGWRRFPRVQPKADDAADPTEAAGRGQPGRGQQEGVAQRRRGRTLMLRLGVSALVVIFLAVALRATRQDALNGGVDVAVQQSNTYGRISLALDATYLDASMLAIQDDHHAYTYQTGIDFTNDVEGLVPGFLWKGKQTETPGARFRHIYQPDIINGWPVGAPTSWYLNFGLLGLLVGGYLTGVMLAALVNARRRAPDNGFNLGVSLITVALVLQLGITPDTPERAVLWWIPLAIVGRLVARRNTGGSPARADVAVSSPRTVGVT